METTIQFYRKTQIVKGHTWIKETYFDEFFGTKQWNIWDIENALLDNRVGIKFTSRVETGGEYLLFMRKKTAARRRQCVSDRCNGYTYILA